MRSNPGFHAPSASGALHTALKRLEEKGYLKSYSGESTKERAGTPWQ
jgi:PadR family transcriptional regulator PadR